MKVLSIFSAIVATTLFGNVISAPFAGNGEALAPRAEVQAREPLTMYYDADLEYEVDGVEAEAVNN